MRMLYAVSSRKMLNRREYYSYDGTFHPTTNMVHVHCKARYQDDDLLDIAATQTLLHGGLVYAVEQANVPGGGLLTAVFRYT